MDKAHILVVDDEPKICELIEALLQRDGYRVTSVQNAAEALALLAREAFHLVLTDLKMPGMDGFELASRLKASSPRLPVVMITGYATVETAVQALRHGIDDYITKPFNIDELRRVVARALEAAQTQQPDQRPLEALQRANVDLARHKELLGRSAALEAAGAGAPEGPLAVHNLLGEILSAEHDLDRLLGRVLAVLVRRFDATYGSIMTLEDGELVLRAAEGQRGRALLGLRRRLGDGIAGQVALRNEAVLVRDIHASGRLPASPDRAYRTPSFVSVPIALQGAVLGVVNLGDKADASPFDQRDLDVLGAASGQVAPSLRNAFLYRACEEQCAAVIEALVALIEGKERYTRGHSHRVSAYAVALARADGLSPAETQDLRRAARLHDLGQITIDDSLFRKPGRLTPEERRLFHAHPAVGERLLEALEFLKPARLLIRRHHERPDGRGYPDGLGGDDVPRGVRILAIADAFDAMTSDRPYRSAMSPEDAAAELQRCAGAHFDENLVRVFCDEVIRPGDVLRAVRSVATSNPVA